MMSTSAGPQVLKKKKKKKINPSDFDKARSLINYVEKLFKSS